MSRERGRTRSGRLAAVERWLAVAGPALPADACVIDVGFGDQPLTTVDWSCSLGPTVSVIGVEREASRVAAAQSFARAGLRFVSVAQASTLPPAHVVRAMNVLRGYPADEAEALRDAWGGWLVDGGLLLEGSTDTLGHVTVAQVLRRSGGRLHREALLFHTDFERGFSPWLFRDWLPRDFRRACHPGTPVHAFLATWSARCEAIPSGQSPRTRFEQSLAQLADVERCDDVVAWRRPPGLSTEIRRSTAQNVMTRVAEGAPLAQNHSASVGGTADANDVPPNLGAPT